MENCRAIDGLDLISANSVINALSIVHRRDLGAARASSMLVADLGTHNAALARRMRRHGNCGGRGAGIWNRTPAQNVPDTMDTSVLRRRVEQYLNSMGNYVDGEDNAVSKTRLYFSELLEAIINIDNQVGIFDFDDENVDR